MAREKVSECRLMLNKGLDPAEENKKRRKETIAEHETLRSQVSFSRCADEWYERNESQWLNAKHRDQIKNTLRDYALSYIGKKNVADVSLEDIRKCLDPIWNTKTASRTHPIRMAKWSEFQLDDNEWNIPAVNMKGKKPFRVALST